MKDPCPPKWNQLALPEGWADRLNLRKLSDLMFFLKRVFTQRNSAIKLDESLIGYDAIPKYALLEFHNLPGGNYSHKITKGYATGFDHVMLGEMGKARNKIASYLLPLTNGVLDLGCGSGHVAGVLESAGMHDVWGVDLSPYLLKHAAEKYPNVNFIQGAIEQSIFSEDRFNALCSCFVLHEIPPKYIIKGLQESFRILKPGGVLYICEPSPEQRYLSYMQVFSKYGFKGCYFKLLSHSVYEPYVDAWHKYSADLAVFENLGFEVVEDQDGFPIRHIILRKPN